MELNKQNIKKICIIVAIGVGLYWLLQNISIIGQTFSTVGSIIFPFILGACIAFVLNIPMTIIEKKWLILQVETERSQPSHPPRC